MSNFGREVVEAVEIDIDYCTRTYGSAPCAAALSADAPHRCHNTRFTCQDPANYDRGALTLRFVKNEGGLPKGEDLFPILQNVSTIGAEINITGDMRNLGGLGSRDEVTVTFKDMTDPDYVTDKYQAERVSGAAQFDGIGYDPGARGTFWGKFRARNEYYVGRPLRLLKGVRGQAWADMRTERYVIKSMAGPDANGMVSITAWDVFDLLSDDKFQYPIKTNGILVADVSETATSFDILGDEAEYETEGRICIGSEIIRYTRSGLTFTVVERAVDGTEVSSHSEGDTVQMCARFENVRVIDAARTIMLAAGIDVGLIPFADWEAQALRWQQGFNVTRTIPQPIGGLKLVAELAAFGCVFHWDKEAQEVKFWPQQPIAPGAVAPIFREAIEEASEGHILQDSVRVTYGEDLRASKVVMHHGTIDPTKEKTDLLNYRQITEYIDPSLSGDDKYGQEQIVTIFNPWLGEDGNLTVADTLTGRRLLRFAQTPVIIEFDVDAKDEASVNLTDLIKTQTRLRQTATGLPVLDEMQVVSREETQAGHRLRIKALSYKFEGNFIYFADESWPDYGSATDEQKATGWFMSDGDNDFADGRPPYVMF